MRPVNAFGTALVGSWAPQKGIAISAITLNKLAQLSNQLAGMFDSESETGQWLRENARHLEAQRDRVLRLSRSMVQLDSYDFGMRRRLARSTARQLKAVHALMQRLGRVLERATGDPQAAALSWEVWEQSKSKVEVEVFWETPAIRRGADPEQTRIGTLHMDLEAPALVLREYVQRECRDRLNELQGDSFLLQKQLDDGSDFQLPRDKESQTFSKDFVPNKMDSKTMVAAFKLVLVPEALEEGSAGTFIPEFASLAGHKKHKHAKKHDVPST
jgi:hypothetical protein